MDSRMKKFTQYLTESTKTYSFTVKIAGDLPESVDNDLKTIMEKFSIVSCTNGKRLPIQKAQLDFPDVENCQVTIWDITVKYPTITSILENYIASNLNYPLHCVKVRNLNEPLEQYQRNLDETCEELLNNPVMGEADPDAQDMVGQRRVTGFLKSIMNQNRMTGDQYKGVNDQILANDLTQDSNAQPLFDEGTPSPIGSHKIDFVNPITGK